MPLCAPKGVALALASQLAIQPFSGTRLSFKLFALGEGHRGESTVTVREYAGFSGFVVAHVISRVHLVSLTEYVSPI